jgi:hypothetical protein
MTQDEICHILDASLGALYVEDLTILRLDVSERAICNQLRAILQRSFADHAVHAEYNRHGILPKEIEMPDGDGLLTLMRVFPDIIVHQPLHDEENVLVIETKKSTNLADDQGDLAKLALMKHQLNYQFAVFIRLSTGPAADINDVELSWV